MTLERLALTALLVFNIDETRALPKELNQRLVAAKGLAEVQHVWKTDHTLYTLVSCTAADGSTLFCMYLFRQTRSKKGTFQVINIPERTPSRKTRGKSDYPIYYAVTPSGYMNGETWKALLDIFLELVALRQGVGREKQAVLFLDGCASHLKSVTPDILRVHNVPTIWFPSNTGFAFSTGHRVNMALTCLHECTNILGIVWVVNRRGHGP